MGKENENELKEIFSDIKSEVLSDEVKDKIVIMMEAKIGERANEKIQEIEEAALEYQNVEKALLEDKAIEYLDTYIIDKFDEYVQYVADQYIKENEMAIESGIKTEMFDKLVSGMKSVLKENQISEDEIESKDEIANKYSKNKNELNQAVEENISLRKEVQGIKAQIIFDQVNEGVSASERETVQNLCADFECDDLNEFKKKVITIKENVTTAISDDDSDDDSDDESHEDYSGDKEIDDGDEDKKLTEEEVNKKLGLKYLEMESV